MKIFVLCTSIDIVKNFYEEHLSELKKLGEVTLITAVTSKQSVGIDVEVIDLALKRQPSLNSDIKNIILIVRYILRDKPDVVISLMPKTGLLAMLAAFLCRVKIRLHIFTGQIWASKVGIDKKFYMLIDSIIYRLATNVYFDGYSQMKFMQDMNVVGIERASVVGEGSISGVDLNKFKYDSEVRSVVRQSLGVKDNVIVILFVGRLNKDKGLDDIFALNENFIKNTTNYITIFVGPDEGGYAEKINSIENMRYIGKTEYPQRYMNAADILILPSRREGFGNVVIESGAVGLPVLATRIYGLEDSVIDEVSGLKYEVGNLQEMHSQLLRLATDAKLRKMLGENGRNRVKKYFSKEHVMREWAREYAAVITAM